MIFVTVGTNNVGFDRLIKKMDEIAGRIDKKVIMQIGYSYYNPNNAQWFKFLKYDEIKNFYNDADIIVSHAGTSTMLDILSLEKPYIIVPRLKEYGENIHSQQMELAKALENNKNVSVVYDINDLENQIERASKENQIERASKLKYYDKNGQVLIKFLNSL